MVVCSEVLETKVFVTGDESGLRQRVEWVFFGGLHDLSIKLVEKRGVNACLCTLKLLLKVYFEGEPHISNTTLFPVDTMLFRQHCGAMCFRKTIIKPPAKPLFTMQTS